ncbi:inositol 1%2C4,5-trisphosphate receptor-interacting protein [Xyrichtys novacula]|uniref:Inositol 1,4,5-trisphosphate receptor-interacting protein n=1 Tax=Xyrichtys novacula TaxID=13765 RepID=A0AAV1EVF9_XYRNO|nr:inositol 1%2C4,5-trisphosphate receptor-interacting protein [Xyrichtys novacula]
MQDTLLRMFVVAVGLLTYPRHDPSVQDSDDMTLTGMQKYEQRLMGGGNKLDNLMEAANEEIMRIGTDSRGPPDDKQNIPEEGETSVRHVPEEEHMPHLEDVTPLKTAQTEHEQGRNSQLDMQNNQQGGVQTGDALGDLRKPEVTQEEAEEVEKIGSKDQESTQPHLHTQTSEKDSAETDFAFWEEGYIWYLCNTLSIISIIRLLRKYLWGNSQTEQGESRVFPLTCAAAEVPLLDNDTLQRFHSKYVKVSADKRWKEEFLEGFADDLIQAMKKVSDKRGGMVIEHFQMMDVYNIIVPFTPPNPWGFQCLLHNNEVSDLPPEMQVCGQIKLVERQEIQKGCPCQSAEAEDMVCLLHCGTEKVKMKIADVHDGPLCAKNSPFLSKSQVTRWFQSTIKEAWAQISHKYEFELNIRYLEAPGALVVRFRSGKKIIFSMSPVVRSNSEAYFFITPCAPTNLDTLWTLSLTTYENHFLEKISKLLPENSCHSQTLEIASFLHRRQTALSGSSALKDFHFKTAVMHLLLTTQPPQWKPDHVAERLQDLLVFMKKSLEKKQLHHALIGNSSTQKIIKLPDEFTKAKMVNLFHPLVVHNCIYRNAVMHFQEMLENAHMLIQDYIDQCADNSSV